MCSILRTSIHPDSRRYPWKTEKFVQAEILLNKEIAVAFQTVRLTIASPALVQELRKLVGYYPNIWLWSAELTLVSPFEILFHHIKALELRRDSLLKAGDETEVQNQVSPPEHQGEPQVCGQKTAQHITMLLGYLKKAYGGRVGKEKSRNKRGLCTFS